MNAREALRALLAASSKPQTGEVVEVASDARSISVRIKSGVASVKVTDATLYAVGDEVLVRDGIAQGKVASLASIPVYNV